MVYIVVTAKILDDGSVQEGKRKQTRVWPAELDVGGLYFLSRGLPGIGELYRVVARVS